MPEPRLTRHVFICTNRRPPGHARGCCAEKGADEVRDAFKHALQAYDVKGRIRANASGCLDQCERGVSVVVYPEQVWYGGVQPSDVREIVEQHILGGVPVDRLRMK